MRGAGDEGGGAASLGPRLIFRSADGLVSEYVHGAELTEDDMHTPGSALPELIAPLLASLHALPDIRGHAPAGGYPPATASPRSPILWDFLGTMLSHIAASPQHLPPGISLAQLSAEVERMRDRCEALGLPVVSGHGDLKPSNVMLDNAPQQGGEGRCQFIDFELAGHHYRGYDLFKLFRTAQPPCVENMRRFLRAYAAASPPPTAADLVGTASGGGASGDVVMSAAVAGLGTQEAVDLLLDELVAESYAAEPLTWLEAAVFFLFAISVYPSQSDDWAPLALQRWERYLSSAGTIDEDGPVTAELLKARAARMEA